MAHSLWPNFSYYGLNAQTVLAAIDALSGAKNADPTLPALLKLKSLELQTKALQELQNIDHGRRAQLVLPSGEGVGADPDPIVLDATQARNLRIAFGNVLKAYLLLLAGPYNDPTLSVVITELDHAGGGLNLPPSPNDQ